MNGTEAVSFENSDDNLGRPKIVNYYVQTGPDPNSKLFGADSLILVVWIPYTME